MKLVVNYSSKNLSEQSGRFFLINAVNSNGLISAIVKVAEKI